MMSATCDQGCYFARPAETLVLEGYRRWMAGFDTGSVAPWELTYSLYCELLGSDQARRALSDLSHFVRTLRRCASCPLTSFPFGAHHICRDECLTLGLIAAMQHGDSDTEKLCLETIACQATGVETAQAARIFADTLSEFDQMLLPIPLSAIEDVLARRRRATFH